MPFCLDDLNDVIDILLADLVGIRFNHDTDHRLRSAFTNENPSVVSKLN